MSAAADGFYFHPSDEDLSLGTPEREKPLDCTVSVKSRIENAVAGKPGTTSSFDAGAVLIVCLRIVVCLRIIPDLQGTQERIP